MRKILYIFTRTPLHIGAGSSVGAIDLPIIRERPTGFPVIPATSLKGTFADEWNEVTNGRIERSDAGKWLFGETDANNASAGALLFSDARLLAFPIRSAKGSFAWITCPLILHRAKRDGVLPGNLTLPAFPESLEGSENDQDKLAFFKKTGPLAIGGQIVLEEYTFAHAGDIPDDLGKTFAELLNDPVWSEVSSRLVVVSDGMMSFFAQQSCEVAQHVRIDDATGTAATGALFNQENVPSEAMFYSVVVFTKGHGRYAGRLTGDAATEFASRLNKPFQFGGDASTGLGWCTLQLI